MPVKTDTVDLVQDFLGKSDPYLEIERENQDGSYTSVLKTKVSLFVSTYTQPWIFSALQVVAKTLNPEWPPVDTNSQQLSNNDPARKLRVH